MRGVAGIALQPRPKNVQKLLPKCFGPSPALQQVLLWCPGPARSTISPDPVPRPCPIAYFAGPTSRPSPDGDGCSSSIAVFCCKLLYIAICCRISLYKVLYWHILLYIAIYCLWYVARHCYLLLYTAIYFYMLQFLPRQILTCSVLLGVKLALCRYFFVSYSLIFNVMLLSSCAISLHYAILCYTIL